MPPFFPGHAYGRILVIDNSFVLESNPDAFTGRDWAAGFVMAREGGLWFSCGSNYAYAAVQVNVTNDPPPVASLDEWDEAIEAAIDFSSPPMFLVPMSEPGYETDIALQDIALEEGPTFVRAYSRGGVEANAVINRIGFEEYRAQQPADPAGITEQVRIDLWPAPSSDTANATPPKILKGQ